ncbi:MAG TPA: phosphoenolpyruvate--protein phosphotransferase [Acetomicrobium flavidum]|uniref:Phosphoenolpyruvate-protein phosphotransferase n=1 Tax=Acetomicrobium mobile (strain ATCC BAA-54 / DSM 13181 / JCM 12221 / NGA) TaxID=891968 RepID=I4BYC9_ACEMN|nr:phosphoenolpyruvate--protein phosphotransferase [Acetomicrobium mobile]AFM22286.1 phosphoenolpyruvate-protein phosphotransferase [Acetomicrobium mobile DSM 13181]HOP87709.1 phosphoenolpyruvate--protein phosphotransferase [Acetomicrobium flavidum]
MSEQRVLKGKPLSPGLAWGRSFLYETIPFMQRNIKIKKEDVEKELDRLKEALKKTKESLQKLKDSVRRRLGEEKAGILEAHMLMLEDPMFVDDIKKAIEEGNSAEDAVFTATEKIKEMFETIPDPYLRERAADVKDVGSRLYRTLLGGKDIAQLDTNEPIIVVANDLAASELIAISENNVVGLVLSQGGPTSHMAIIAKSLNLPAVSGIDISLISDNCLLIVDGIRGEITINPSSDVLMQTKNNIEKLQREQEEALSLKDLPAVTPDGLKIELWGNIAHPDEASAVLSSGGSGIGLFRTEFLFMNRNTPPSEDEQFEAYRKVLDEMKPHPVVIRTLDAGGDKEIPYLNIPKEDNPFLGYRAIRIGLTEEQLLITQLKALIRSSICGNLYIMFPMISSLWEIRRAKTLIQKAASQLDDKGMRYGKLKVGIMIEIPSAAIMAEELAKEVDFFSIGTNDLTQYTLAVDRGNSKVSQWYDHLHPAVLKLIAMTSKAAKTQKIELGICGEMAGDPFALPVLLGLGFDELSMSPPAIPKIKRLVRKFQAERAKQVAQMALSMKDADEVRQYLNEVMAKP